MRTTQQSDLHQVKAQPICETETAEQHCPASLHSGKRNFRLAVFPSELIDGLRRRQLQSAWESLWKLARHDECYVEFWPNSTPVTHWVEYSTEGTTSHWLCRKSTVDKSFSSQLVRPVIVDQTLYQVTNLIVCDPFSPKHHADYNSRKAFDFTRAVQSERNTQAQHSVKS